MFKKAIILGCTLAAITAIGSAEAQTFPRGGFGDPGELHGHGGQGWQDGPGGLGGPGDPRLFQSLLRLERELALEIRLLERLEARLGLPPLSF
jgi:hypothetical protein